MKRLNINDIEICETSDKSTTLLHKEYNTHYRSIHGAASESDWVFIQGSQILHQDIWTVAELGFGLGTNFSKLIEHSWEHQNPIHYIAFDHQPLPPEVIPQKENPSDFEVFAHALITNLLLQSRDSHQSVTIESAHVKVTLHPFDLLNIPLIDQSTPQSQPFPPVLAFFHDPFGPAANPEAWTVECFQRIAQILHPDGIMTTYGAAGHARRAMVAAGLHIASAPGFGKKREITFAAHDPKRLHHASLITKYRPHISGVQNIASNPP